MSILQLGLWELDVTSSTMTFNEDFSIKMGYEKDHFAKISLKEWLSFIHEEDRTNYELLLELFTSKKSNFYEHEYRIKNKFNQWVWVNDRGAILSSTHGQEPLCVIGVLSDISERKKDEENFRFQAEHDTLTNLASPRVAINSLQLSLKRAKRTKEHLALLMIDIDEFKSINDRFGHMAGDAVLKEFAGRLTYYFRESDMISRISGDEFLIILYQADPHVTHGLLNNLGSSLAEPYLLNGEKITVSASIGVVFFPEDDQSPNPLLKKADEALYLAKETGKNKICYWKDHFTNEKKT